jgi:hypothetical protein
MESWVVIVVVVAVVLFVRASQRRQVTQRQREEVAAQELASVRRTADEDVTQFGEELQRLDAELAGRELDAGARSDYQRALDAYEDAKRSVGAVREPEEIRHVATILEDGRYAVACVHARVGGRPLPERRPPCFFNPQHGPSVADVAWTPVGGTTRDVPACALDAERVKAGADPDARTVMVGAERMPYWQAGPAYAPYAGGYFGAFGIMPALFMGTMMGMALGGFDGSYADGFADGQDAGAGAGDADGSGFDGGGFDGGDLDAGGFDGAGFDGFGF